MLGTNKLVKELKLYAKNPASITKDDLTSYHQKLELIRSIREKFTQLPAAITDKLGGLYMGTGTDWTLVLQALEKAEAVRRFCAGADKARRTGYLDAIAGFGNEREITDAVAGVRTFGIKMEELSVRYHVNLADLEESSDWVSAAASAAKRYKSNLSGLKNWVVVQLKSEQLKEAGLSCVVEAWKRGSVDAGNIQNAYESNLYYALVLKTIREDARLKEFQGRQY